MDPTLKKIMSGKKSNLAGLLQTSPPHTPTATTTSSFLRPEGFAAGKNVPIYYSAAKNSIWKPKWKRIFLSARYRYEDGAPTEARWVDLALSRYSNPCGDLAYFFYISTTPKLRKTHLEEMLLHYHGKLTDYLAALGEDQGVYTFRYFFWGKMFIFLFYPPFLWPLGKYLL